MADLTLEALTEAEMLIRKEIAKQCRDDNNIISRCLLTAQLNCGRAIDCWQDYLTERR